MGYLLVERGLDINVRTDGIATVAMKLNVALNMDRFIMAVRALKH
jgi:hypothetical protein